MLIADDHALVRQGLEALLHDAGDIEVVGAAADGRQTVAEAERLEPDVVLMDLAMPEMDGVRATAAIRAGGCEARILALSGSAVEARIVAALKAGALGYVSKSAPRDELIEAIRLVHRGRPWMPPETTSRLLDSRKPATRIPEPLTERELEVLRLVAKGLPNQTIAARLHVREGTVRNHLTSIFAKLGVGNRVEATLCALRDGLTSLDESLEPVTR